MHEKLKEKREEELARQKKVKFLDLLYTNIKYAPFPLAHSRYCSQIMHLT